MQATKQTQPSKATPASVPSNNQKQAIAVPPLSVNELREIDDIFARVDGDWASELNRKKASEASTACTACHTMPCHTMQLTDNTLGFQCNDRSVRKAC